MTKVDCEDCYEKFTSKKLYINHVKSKSCSKTKVKNRQRAGHQQQEAVGQGAKRVRLEGDYYKPFKETLLLSPLNIRSNRWHLNRT